MKIKIFLLSAVLLLPAGIAAAEETPRQQSERVVRESMAKAQADKARNDRIVDAQRAKEKAAKASKVESGDNTKAAPTPKKN